MSRIVCNRHIFNQDIFFQEKNCLASRVCHGDPKNYPKGCTKMTKSSMNVTMGYYWRQNQKGSREAYTIEVKEKAPYCIKLKN